MDAEILAAVWFNCKDLSDTQHKLLLALAFHGSPCWPSVKRLSQMIRRTGRQTRTLLYELQELGYISIKVQRGRKHSNLYELNRKRILPISAKIGSEDFLSKSEVQTSPELLLEKERKKEEQLRRLGLTPGSQVWIASLNGHQK